jgi:hypothetical protein
MVGYIQSPAVHATYRFGRLNRMQVVRSRAGLGGEAKIPGCGTRQVPRTTNPERFEKSMCQQLRNIWRTTRKERFLILLNQTGIPSV